MRIINWTKAGVIEEVPEVDYHSTKGKHYLPHHAIIKPHSTTPVRPVFDASAREPGKFSLNDCLSKGPNLIEKIPASLAKFRKGRIGISGDIEKAFLQISVCPSDRDFLRFLWEDEDGIVKIYRHCRVVFGVSSSPFLLEAVLKLHLESTLTDCREGKLSWPINLVELCSFYVDNCLVSTDSQTEAEQFTKIASSIMQEKNFNLRGWELSGEVDGNTPNILGLRQLQLFASKGKKHDLKLGDLVLVGDDHSKRIQWPLGRVVHLVPGKDGEIRVAHVHTANGTIVRPVQRLYLLQSDPSYEAENEPDSNLTSDMQPAEMSDVQQQLQGTPDLQSDDDSNDGEFSTSKTADPQSGRNLDRPSSPSVVHHPITNVDPEPDETIPIPQYHLNRRGRMIRKPNRFL
ncbi:hypothetical protein M8J77_022611 [Diaphorina citri]|nr:hypothetical protein M8J77_022611 [Diaphorina citri]